MLTAVLCVVICVCVIATIYAKLKPNAHKLPPAHPGWIPIIGHTYMLVTSTSKLWLKILSYVEYAVNKGGVIHFVFGNQIYYMIVDPEDALTASNACLQKHFSYDFAKPWLGDGMLTASGEIWKRHRKLLQPAFGLPVIHGFLNVFNNQAKKLIREVEPHEGKGPFNHEDYLRKISLETFCQGTFGIDAIEDNNFVQNYMKSVDIALNTATRRFQTFWLHSDFMYKFSGLKKRADAAVNKLNMMSNEIMQRKRTALKKRDIHSETNYLNSADVKYKPVLDLLLELSADGTLTDKEIREEMDTMIATGFETTSNQLMYTLMLLGVNPNTQNKLYEEVMEVLGPVEDVDKDDINKLVYTNAVLMESLRVCPSVPLLLRYVEKDVKLKNYTMRADSQCLICPLVHKHDPSWGSDGDQFQPERWLADADLCGKKEFAAFGLGKRACIGRQYAMISMKVFLVHFIRQYRVTADMSRLKLKYDFVLKPIVGQEISIERRI